MRKIWGISLCGLSMLLSGCVFENELLSSAEKPAERIHKYVGIAIRTNDASSTRDKEFEDGTAANENNIRLVRFYFFDGKGKGFEVTNDGTPKSYIDFVPESSTDDSDNVEKILEAVLTILPPIDEQENLRKPTSLIAIVNPPASLSTANIVDKEILIENNANYLPGTQQEGEEYFVMSNSVYADADKEKVVEVSLADKVFKDRVSAMQNPVDIFVERVVAKVRLTLSLKDETSPGSGIFKLPFSQNGDSNSIEIAGKDNTQDVYIRFLGWNVTAKADRSNLLKNIYPQWDDSNLFGSSIPWNEGNYHRSFWAINPKELKYIYGDFDGISDNQNTPDPNRAILIKAFDSNNGKRNYTYVQENASKNEDGEDNDTHTQIIIGAQLVDKNGNGLEFAEYGYKYYTIDRLKTLYANNVDLWKQISDDTYVKISPDDIEFKTASSLGIEYNKNDATKLTDGIKYYVYPQLIDGTYYTRETGTQDNFTEEANGNEILRSLGPAKIWKDGYTYYFLNIEHLGAYGNSSESTQSKRHYGVVRNHIYDYRVTSVIGLGAPVFDPDEVIIPEDKDENTTLTVELKITNWRLFRKQLEFNW